MANTKFDAKSFNAEAFKYIVERIPNLKMNEIKKSRALVGNPDIKDVFSNQNGTGYARIVMRGLADGDAVNYDGSTDITATSTKTFEQGVVVVGRAKGWIERDFSYDITGGVDFMQNIAQQIAEYKDGLDQDTLLSILSGIFGMTGTKNAEFVTKHTTDITGATTPTVGATTLNSAIGKACGANKKKFSMVFMHSDVATNLENINVLEYMKYTDKDDIQRDIGLATWNGKLVIIDDAMPLTQVTDTEETKGVHTLTVGTAATSGDKITIGGVEYTFDTATSYANKTLAVGTTSSTQATAIKTVLAEQYASVFTVTTSSNTVILTQKVGGTGELPDITVTQGVSGTLVASITNTTPGVAEETSTTYITYVLGEGAISYEDIGVKVPYEMDRNPATNGGQDTLYIRQRKCFAPFGISYEKASQSSTSPTDTELATGANWSLVHSGEASEANRTYINHKAIAIARIISKG